MLKCSDAVLQLKQYPYKWKANAHDGKEGRVQNGRCTSSLHAYLKQQLWGLLLLPTPQDSALGPSSSQSLWAIHCIELHSLRHSPYRFGMRCTHPSARIAFFQPVCWGVLLGPCSHVPSWHLRKWLCDLRDIKHVPSLGAKPSFTASQQC